MKQPKKLLNLFLDNGKVSTDTRTICRRRYLFWLEWEIDLMEMHMRNKLWMQVLLMQLLTIEKYYDPKDDRLILVENSLNSLQQLAKEYRSLFTIPILGITGSNGKTTTKELIYACLKTEKNSISQPKGNLNNHIGVPLSLLSIPPDVDIAIIEMGTNQPGDIAELVRMARPTLALITNIGHAHLEKLGSLDGVRREKGVLYEYVKAAGGPIFVNMADPHLVEGCRSLRPCAVTYNTPQVAISP